MGFVTKFVTGTDAVVLSPLEEPQRPEDLPNLFDAFVRCAGALEKGTLALAWDGARPIIGHSTTAKIGFVIVFVLRDGTAPVHLLPDAWNGRITREVVASFFTTTFALAPRPPSWGAHAFFVDGDAADATVVTMRFPVEAPLVDPYREAATEDHEHIIPLELRYEPPWDTFLTPWEQVEGYFAQARPAQPSAYEYPMRLQSALVAAAWPKRRERHRSLPRHVDGAEAGDPLLGMAGLFRGCRRPDQRVPLLRANRGAGTAVLPCA
jgi:hypothetical protein